jgi:hypothetical protein
MQVTNCHRNVGIRTDAQTSRLNSAAKSGCFTGTQGQVSICNIPFSIHVTCPSEYKHPRILVILKDYPKRQVNEKPIADPQNSSEQEQPSPPSNPMPPKPGNCLPAGRPDTRKSRFGAQIAGPA